MTTAPAAILRLEKGTLSVGADADVTVLDPEAERKVDPDRFLSRSRNCPFAGRTLKGWPAATIVAGRVVFLDGEIRV